jgi:sortase A
MIARDGLRWLQGGLLILGLLLLGRSSSMAIGAHHFQAATSSAFDLALRDAAGAPSATADLQPPAAAIVAVQPPKRDAEAGTVLGRIEIPRLSMTAMVAEGVDTKTLGRSVGHVPSTAWPGEAGNCGLAGHRDTFFRGLGDIRVDDIIRIVTIERTTTYSVEWTEIVEPTRVDVLDSTATRSLTLVTCYPFAFIGRAPQRFIVRARLVEDRPASRFEHSSNSVRGFTPGSARRSPSTR